MFWTRLCVTYFLAVRSSSFHQTESISSVEVSLFSTPCLAENPPFLSGFSSFLALPFCHIPPVSMVFLTVIITRLHSSVGPNWLKEKGTRLDEKGGVFSYSISALIPEIAAHSTQGRVRRLCRCWLQNLSLNCFGFPQFTGDETDKWGFDGRKKDISHFVLWVWNKGQNIFSSLYSISVPFWYSSCSSFHHITLFCFTWFWFSYSYMRFQVFRLFMLFIIYTWACSLQSKFEVCVHVVELYMLVVFLSDTFCLRVFKSSSFFNLFMQLNLIMS